jgi:hypothetical protein
LGISGVGPLPRKIPKTPVANRSKIGVTTVKIRGFNRWISGCIDFSVFKKTSSLGISGVDALSTVNPRDPKNHQVERTGSYGRYGSYS